MHPLKRYSSPVVYPVLVLGLCLTCVWITVACLGNDDPWPLPTVVEPNSSQPHPKSMKPVVLSALAANIPPQPTQYAVTVVSAYFSLDKSKYTQGHYATWMKQFMPSITAPLIFFTTRADEPGLRSLRGSLPAVYMSYPSIWDVPAAAAYKELFLSHHAKDPEKEIHNPDLYGVWNSKAWFTLVAAAQNPFNSTYFVWVDAGSFRIRAFSSWPDPNRVAQALTGCYHCLILSKIRPDGASYKLDAKDAANVDGMIIQAGFYAGTRDSMLWWAVNYFDLLDDSARHGQFVGKEQILMNKLAVLNYWRVRWVAAYRASGCGNNEWFAFQPMFAMPNESCPMAIESFNGTINVKTVHEKLGP